MATQKFDSTHYQRRVDSYRQLEKAIQQLVGQFKPRSFERQKLGAIAKDLKSSRSLAQRWGKFVGGAE